MTRRDRLEDLGIITVMIENILSHQLFQEEWFVFIQSEEREILLKGFGEEICAVQDSLFKVLEIAKGKDSIDDRS